MKTYSEKLKDPRWQRKRLEIMQRDEFRCVDCGDSKSTLNVHHLKYASEPWAIDNQNLVTLCEPCHSSVENTKKAIAIILATKPGRRELASFVKSFNQPRLSALESFIMDAPCGPPSVTIPTPIHRTVAALCNFAIASQPVRRFLMSRSDDLSFYGRWLTGIPILLSIIARGEDSSESIMDSLSEGCRMALLPSKFFIDTLENKEEAAHEAMEQLSRHVLYTRDSAIKSQLKIPTLPRGRLIELLEEAKDINVQIRKFGQRTSFDDELPASTFRPKTNPWNKNFREAGK